MSDESDCVTWSRPTVVYPKLSFVCSVYLCFVLGVGVGVVVEIQCVEHYANVVYLLCVCG